MNSRRHILAMLLAALWLSPASSQDDAVDLLFFGNIITYVGNLPAVLSELCSVSGYRCQSEMIVQGGASLTERVANESLSQATSSRDFAYLILQERGGDLIPLPGQEQMRDRAESAAASLVDAARRQGIEPILLGTYQELPSASSALVAAESALAASLEAIYVPVSNFGACAKSQEEGLRWFDEDGMHPGPELTLMMAVLLYQELFGSLPDAEELIVQAPIYGVSSGLSADTIASDQDVPARTPSSMLYDVGTVQKGG